MMDLEDLDEHYDTAIVDKANKIKTSLSEGPQLYQYYPKRYPMEGPSPIQNQSPGQVPSSPTQPVVINDGRLVAVIQHYENLIKHYEELIKTLNENKGDCKC